MKHLIKIESTPHGVLGVRHTGLDQQYCEAGELVILEWQPDAKWGLQEAHYTDGDGNVTAINLTRVKVDGVDVVAFVMPNKDITIGGTFKRFVVHDWTEGKNPNVGATFVSDENGSPVTDDTLLHNLGFEDFDDTQPYNEGDIVVYDGNLYQFTADHSGAWTGDDVDETSVAEVLDLLSHQNDVYGVSFDETLSSPAKPRVGNMALHQSLPIQSGMRRCLLKDDGTVNYYLDASDSTLKADGTAADLSGADGQVMVEVPEHWRKVTKEGDVVTAMVSTYWQKGWKHVPSYYIGAYQATVDQTLSTKNKLCSVVNATDKFRGGNNTTGWDGTYRDLRGKPRTALSMNNYRTYARNRGSESWNFLVYDLYIDLYWLYVIEFANTNSQAAINASLTAEGYRQGGLGDGVTNLTEAKWNAFNSYNPFLDCGITNSLGNGTGKVSYTMPFQYDASGEANYGGEYDAAVECVADKFYSSGDLLYKCIQTNTGESLTNTSYFTAVTRTVTNVCSYRGVENIFGQIFHWIDGVKFNDNKIYRCADPSKYSSAAEQGDYVLEGDKCESNGYATKMTIAKDGSIIPTAVDGGSTTYYCDYYYQANAAGVWYGCAVGGDAANGTSAGLAYVSSHYSVALTVAYFGSRLCFFKKSA